MLVSSLCQSIYKFGIIHIVNKNTMKRQVLNTYTQFWSVKQNYYARIDTNQNIQ